MTNFRIGATALGLTFAALVAAPALAEISTAVCSAEGGDVIQVSGSDVCLVPIRPAEYAGAEYDGNRLGIVDCQGDKISDGAYCMEPITGGAVGAPKAQVTPSTPSLPTTSLSGVAGSALGGSTPSISDVGSSIIGGSTPSISDVGSSVIGGSTPSLGSVATGAVLGGGVPSTGDVADIAIDAAKDAATDAANKAVQDQAKKQVTGVLGGLGK